MAKGRKLKPVPGDTTRPTMDRVKENLFNILGEWVKGTRWLDLFAGTGQVGIEALSRGAVGALFLDTAPAAIKTIRENLALTRLEANAQVWQRDALHYLRGNPAAPFDAIYVAPPQYKGVWLEALKLIDQRPDDWLTAEGIVIAQIDPKEYVALELSGLGLYDQRKYGRTMLCFYEKMYVGEDQVLRGLGD